MSAAPQHEIKSADAVIAEDVICQSFIQSSCTLAYACLLIRRRRFELAAHVLHSLEAKQASRFKDMVFYLQAQIGIETGEYAMVKKRLVPRVNQHPNDLVAVSLLETSIYREFEAREAKSPASDSGSRPNSAFGNAEAASAAVLASSYASTALPPEEAAAQGASRSRSVPVSHVSIDPVAATPVPAPARPQVATSAIIPVGPRSAEPFPTVHAQVVPPGIAEMDLASLPVAPAPIASPGREPSRGHRAGSSGDGDMGLYQGIAADPNTQAMGFWGKLRSKSYCRAPALEPLMAILPRELPAALQAACGALEAGPIHKICLSFQHLTVSTFHAGAEGMAHVTGPLNQNLLSIVRAENTFKKAAMSGLSTGGGSPASAGGSAASGANP